MRWKLPAALAATAVAATLVACAAPRSAPADPTVSAPSSPAAKASATTKPLVKVKPLPVCKRVGVSDPIERLAAFIKMSKCRPTTWSVFQSWSDRKSFNVVSARKAYALGVPITVTWQPENPVPVDHPRQPAYSDRQIMSGRYDAYIKRYAESIKAYGHAVTIRFAHEMNGNWYPWSPQVNGNSNASYIAMWRYVVTKFRKLGVKNVRWQWAPNDDYHGATSMAAAYPGSKWVDSVALSGYNWGPGTYSRWESFSALYNRSLTLLRKAAPGKPLYIAEIGSATKGGSQAAWITDMFRQVRGRRYIKGIVWFDQPGQQKNWLIESSKASVRAWQRGVRSLG